MTEIYMKWRPDFNLGIEEIDEQHKKIVELINRLNDAFMKDETNEKLGDILNEMAAYADYHFKSEEELFQAHNFPFSEEHINLHKKFSAKVQAYQSKFKEGQPVTFRVLGFLKDWLTNHILDADREYGPLVRDKLKKQE